jgi:hypothetical protein
MSKDTERRRAGWGEAHAARPLGNLERSAAIEHARMKNRTVLQWDKDDGTWIGLRPGGPDPVKG